MAPPDKWAVSRGPFHSWLSLMRCYLFEDDLTAMLPYTTADIFAFVDIPGRDLCGQGLEKMRVAIRVRNVTNALCAQWSDPGYPDQVYLGAPRTLELSASAKW